ncbi:MAG: hypothetical protein HY868_16600 [Chloroflexi bacterium]|nr:hypothetical protein [Chloroflexota bacterium]
MAVLKKHGAELVRVRLDQAAQDDPDIKGHVYERAYMSDGTVLEKVTTRWHGRAATCPGWKIRGKVKPGKSPADIAAFYAAKGWEATFLTTLSPSIPILRGVLEKNQEQVKLGLSDQTQFVL